MNATINANANANATQEQTAERFALRISAITGTEDAKESSTLWIGRQIGKAPRKDLQLSQELPKVAAAQVAKLDAEKVALIINDEFAAYVRRVKCQRLDLTGNSSIELMLPINADVYAEMVVSMLSAPATRTKRLVSTATIRAMLLSREYKTAALQVLGAKLDAWRRVGEREMLPTAVAQDAKIPTARASVRDVAVVRCMEIAALMPECEHKLVLTAAAELLAEVEVVDMDDSI